MLALLILAGFATGIALNFRRDGEIYLERRETLRLERSPDDVTDPAKRGAEACAGSAERTESRRRSIESQLLAWLDDDDPEKRETRIHELDAQIESIGGVAQRLKLIESLPPGMKDFALGLPIFQSWMGAHPELALEWIGSQEGVSPSRVLTLVQRWSEASPADFERYLGRLPPGAWKETVMTAACYQALPDSPVAVIRRARELRSTEQRVGIMESATREWARRDVVAATNWVGRVEDEDLQERLLGALAVGYAEAAPEFAAGWALRALPRGNVLDAAAAEIARVWSTRDPERAAVWVENLPAGGGRQRALGALLNVWMNRDSASALAWINGSRDGDLAREARVYLSAEYTALAEQ